MWAGHICTWRDTLLTPVVLSPRSSDFGTSYTKLTLQPGVTTVIDNFYICPTNKRKVSGTPGQLPLRTAGLRHRALALVCPVTAFPAPPWSVLVTVFRWPAGPAPEGCVLARQGPSSPGSADGGQGTAARAGAPR